METIPVKQIDHINAKSQKRKNPGITADKPFMESCAYPPFIKPSKQDENRDCVLILILSSRQFTCQSHLTSLYMIQQNTILSSESSKTIILLQLPQN